MKGTELITILILMASISFALQSECDYKVDILVNGEEFEKEEFTWRMKAINIEGKSTNITAIAKIEDSNGRIVKIYKPWTNDSILKLKTSNEYTPNLKKGGEYKIIAEIEVECNDKNRDNNLAVKKIKIKDKKEEISIKEIVSITNAQKVNNETNNKKIENKTLEESQLKKSMTNDSIKNDELQSTAYVIQTLHTAYESSSEKSKELIVLFLLALSVLLNIILIWKR